MLITRQLAALQWAACTNDKPILYRPETSAQAKHLESGSELRHRVQGTPTRLVVLQIILGLHDPHDSVIYIKLLR